MAISRKLSRFGIGAALFCVLVGVVIMGFGAKRLFTYSWPMVVSDYDRAAQSTDGNKAIALYDLGLKAYRAGAYQDAQEILTKAYSAMTEENQNPLGIDHDLGARVQFLLAVSYERSKQNFMAIEAYKQALRHDPNHLEAKYNLERLLAKRGGGGQGQGEGDGEGKPGDKTGSGQSQQGKKGI
jgi:Ca-activated chloride channel family protein